MNEITFSFCLGPPVLAGVLPTAACPKLNKDALNLLNLMLAHDPKRRISARDAL